MFTDLFLALLIIIVFFLIFLPAIWLLIWSKAANEESYDETLHCHWSDDHWRTDGSLKLGALAHLDDTIAIPKSDHHITINDFLAGRLRKPPKSGDIVKDFNLRFVVITRTNDQVGQVSVYADRLNDRLTFNLPN